MYDLNPENYADGFDLTNENVKRHSDVITMKGGGVMQGADQLPPAPSMNFETYVMHPLHQVRQDAHYKELFRIE